MRHMFGALAKDGSFEYKTGLTRITFERPPDRQTLVVIVRGWKEYNIEESAPAFGLQTAQLTGMWHEVWLWCVRGA
jgi:hypothetical protein